MATKTILLLVMLSIISVCLTQNAGKGEKNVRWSIRSPLTLPAMEGLVEEIENILQQKYESSNRSSGMSPLHWTALPGDLPSSRVLRVLLKLNADIRALDKEKNTELHVTAAGSFEAVQELISLAKDGLNAENNHNSTATHFGVNKEDLEVVKEFIRTAKAGLNAENNHNSTAIHLAVNKEDLEAVKELIRLAKDGLNAQNNHNSTTLHLAVNKEDLEAVKEFIRLAKAGLNAQNNHNSTAIHLAVNKEDLEAVKELIRLAKAGLNAQNNHNTTALHLAVDKEDLEAVRKLLRFGAWTNITDDEGRSPLDLAIERNNLNVAAFLRSSGAKEIKYGKTTSSPTTTMAPATTTRPSQFNIPKATRKPEVRELTGKEMKLHEAAQNNQYTIIAELCSEGVDPNVADIKNNGKTALHLAAANNGKLAVLTLVRCSANLDVKDFNGNTPLHLAVIKNYPWSADMLLMLGANPNISNDEGKSSKDLSTPWKHSNFLNTFKSGRIEWIKGIRPLSISERNLLRQVEKGYYMGITESCKKGVDVRVKDANHKQYTMLHYAVSIKKNIPGTIQMLIRCGADINARDADGNTPLHLAVLKKFFIAKESLLLNGADPSIANAAGKTAYQMLKESSPDEIDSRLHWYRNGMLL